MKHYESFNIKLEVVAGTYIEAIATEAVELAGKLDTEIYFNYNGMKLSVHPTTTIREITYAYYQWKEQSNSGGKIDAT